MLLTASALNARALPLGLISAGPQHLELPLVYSCSVCSFCGARGNVFCQIQTSRWCCVFCSQWNALDSSKTREFTYSAFTTNIHDEGSKARRSHHCILVVDESLPGEERNALRDSVAEAVNSLPDDTYFGLITFGGAVRIYEMGSMGSRIASEVFNGSSSPSSEDIREIALHENASSGHESFVSPLHVCRGQIFNTFNFLAHRPSSKLQRDAPRRCLGPAIEYALALCRVCDVSSASIVVVAEGPGTSGPGAWRPSDPAGVSAEMREAVERDRRRCLDYFASLSATAREVHCNVDVFISGKDKAELGALPLLELTPSVHLRSASCAQTLAMGLGGNGSPLHTVRVSISDPNRLAVVHVAGASGDVGSMSGASMTFDGRTKPTVFLENRLPSSSNGSVIIPSNEPPIYLQTAVRKEFSDKEFVITEKLTVARPFNVMNGEAIAVVVARRACIIAQSNNQDVNLARRHVENELYNVSRLVAEEVLDQAEFDKLAVALFHFYRGPLLGGPGSQYVDEDVECLQARFIKNTTLEEALLMMAPRLEGYRWDRLLVGKGASGLLSRSLPLSTLSLESDMCLVLDQLTDVFVWFGSDVPVDAKERQTAVMHARQLAGSGGRYPVSRVITFEETSPRARWLRCRLSPEHCEVGSSSTTGMGMITEEKRRLVNKLWNTPMDTLTFNAFMQIALGGLGKTLSGNPKQQQQRSAGTGRSAVADDRVYRML